MWADFWSGPRVHSQNGAEVHRVHVLGGACEDLVHDQSVGSL